MEKTTKPELEKSEESKSFSKKMGTSNPTGFTKKEQQTIFRAINMMSQIALTAVACVLIGVFLGQLLDSWLGTSPWLLIIFLLIGCGSAFKTMIDIAKKF